MGKVFLICSHRYIRTIIFMCVKCWHTVSKRTTCIYLYFLSPYTFPLSLVTLSTSFLSSLSAAIRHRGPASEIIRLTPASFIHVSMAITQLELIRPYPCFTAEPSMLHETDQYLPVVIKHQSVKCLTLCSGLAISQSHQSKTSLEQTSPTWLLLAVVHIETDPKSLSFMCLPLEVWCVRVKW